MVRGIRHWFTAAARGALLLMAPAVLAMLLPVPARAQTASEGPFRLIGIITGREFTGAVLDDSTGSQTFYRLRESLPDGSQIVSVAGDRISLKRNDGTSYQLFIIHDASKSSPQPRPPAAVTPAAMQTPAPLYAPVLPQAGRENQRRPGRASPGGANGGQQAAVQGAGNGSQAGARPDKTAKQAAGARRHGSSDANEQ